MSLLLYVASTASWTARPAAGKSQAATMPCRGTIPLKRGRTDSCQGLVARIPSGGAYGGSEALFGGVGTAVMPVTIRAQGGAWCGGRHSRGSVPRLMRLYATKRGERPLIGVAGAACQCTVRQSRPTASSRRSR